MSVLAETAPYTWLLDALFDGAYCVDRERRITYWNAAAERFTGFAAHEVVGTTCAANILRHVDAAGTNLCTGTCPLAVAIRDGIGYEAEVYLHHRDGHRLPVLVRCTPLHNAAGEIIGGVELFSDATHLETLRRRMAELEAMAYVDALTGLANRRHLDETLRQRLEEWRRFGWRFGVLLADIDDFKAINDIHGHDVGDQVLRMVGRTLGHNCRAFDLFGRWGGDEFLGIFPNVDAPTLSALANRLRALTAASFLTLPGNTPLTVTLSIGITVVLPDDTPDPLFHRVDRHLYASKMGGRNRVTGDEDMVVR